MENQCAVIKLTNVSEPSLIKLSSVNSSQERHRCVELWACQGKRRFPIYPPPKHPVIGLAQRWRCVSCSTVRYLYHFREQKKKVDEFLRLLGYTNSLK